ERVRHFARLPATALVLGLLHTDLAGAAGRPIVRVFIDEPGGITHEDCSEMSHHLSTVLDVEDFSHSPYTLEVSSPGVERGLYKLADYERFAGQTAKIKSRVA